MIDHLHNTHSVGLEYLAILVLDEADRLLELGFSNEVHELVSFVNNTFHLSSFQVPLLKPINDKYLYCYKYIIVVRPVE